MENQIITPEEYYNRTPEEKELRRKQKDKEYYLENIKVIRARRRIYHLEEQIPKLKGKIKQFEKEIKTWKKKNKR